MPLIPSKPLSLNAQDRTGNCYRLRVHVLDTFCLAPEGASLDALGKLLGYPKLSLPAGYTPSEMARFRKEQPELFFAYLRRDAEISARYAQRYAVFCAINLGLRRPPGTLGGAAVAVLLNELKQMGLDRLDLYGLKAVKTTEYSPAAGRKRSLRKEDLIFANKLIFAAASDAYSGGRTETFMTGPIAGLLLRDIDLRSAYPSMMAALGILDYSGLRIVRDDELAEFTAGVAGVAEIEFDTPDELRYPVFGIRTHLGLIFPRRGVTVATAPEIAAAGFLGVAVRIKLGLIIPWDQSVRPYEHFVVQMIKLRESLKKDGRDTPESKTVKFITNSVYGKTAQGVRERMLYDPRTGGSKALGRSAVTSPIYAALTTGGVRAPIAEMLNSIPRDEVVVSVTTDGFFTSARLEDIRLDGPATQVLLAARRRIADQTS